MRGASLAARGAVLLALVAVIGTEVRAADFTATPTSGCAPLEVTITITDAASEEGVISRVLDFGDGSTADPSELTHTHVYTDPGTYTVTLILTLEGQVIVRKNDYVTVHAAPTADFMADVLSGCAPLSVHFADLSGGAIDWTWDFGDGATSSEQNPDHTYLEAGIYSVKLTASDHCEDLEEKINYVTVKEAPAPPASVAYPTRAFLGDIVPVTWAGSPEAASYILEGRIGEEGEWFEVCVVEAGGPELALYTCRRLLDEVNRWFFRVAAENNCGPGETAVGLPLEVLPPALVAFWPFDNCRTNDDGEEGHDGTIAGGLLRCGRDRFGQARSAFEFVERGGIIEGDSLPVLRGDFSVSLWVEPGVPAESDAAGDVSLFAIYPLDADSDPGIARLEFLWNPGDLAFTVRHGALESEVRVRGVAPAWHHLLASREGEALKVYLDGVLAGSLTDRFGLGAGFTMGDSAEASAFRGKIDEVLYEGRPRREEEVLSLILGQSPTVYLEPSGTPDEVSALPGEVVGGALELGLRQRLEADPEKRSLANLELRFEEIPPAPDGDVVELLFPSEYVERITLYMKPGCADAISDRDEVGTFELVSETPGKAVFRLVQRAPFQLPSETEVCLLADLTLAPSNLPANPIVRLDLETADALEVRVAANRIAFIAGQRRFEEPAVAGKRIHIVNRLPELFLGFLLPTAREPERGPLDDEELHRVTLSAGDAEGIQVEAITYRATAGTTLRGVTDARLFVERNGNVLEVVRGTIDAGQGMIEFHDFALEIPLGNSADLFLLADLEVIEETQGVEILFVPSPSAPLLPAVLALVAFSILGLLAALARQETRRLVAAATLSIPSSLVILCVGCGPAVIGAVAVVALSSDGGSGGSGGSIGLVEQFQVSLSPNDLRAKGSTTQAPADLRFESEEVETVPGPLFEVTEK